MGNLGDFLKGHACVTPALTQLYIWKIIVILGEVKGVGKTLGLWGIREKCVDRMC